MHPVVRWLVLSFLLSASNAEIASVRVNRNPSPPDVAGVAAVLKRDAVEDRSDFVGYIQLDNGTYQAFFCHDPGDTATTVGSIFDCCPAGNSCSIAIGCTSTSFLVRTASGTTTKYNCAGAFAPPGMGCASQYVYQHLENTATKPLTYVGCRLTLGIFKSVVYYQTLTAGAESLVSTPSWAPGQLATTSTMGRTSPIATATDDALSSSKPLTDDASMPTSPSATAESAGETNTATASSESGSSSSGQLSRSDQIAIGIGLGIGLPTVILGILGLFFRPGQWRWPRRQSMMMAHGSAGSVPTQSPRP